MRTLGRANEFATLTESAKVRIREVLFVEGVTAMSPDEALARQIEMYRRMTGEQRLKIALDLHTFACNVTREGIRRQFPHADEAEVERQLRRRLEMART